MDVFQMVAEETSIQVRQVAAAVKLFDDDNTIPFIARYRKEMTGSLDEVQLRQIKKSLEKLRSLNERRTLILNVIREQGKLSAELSAKINASQSRTELEDLYLPFRPKRRTRAGVARERGLQSLAEILLKQPESEHVVEQAITNSLNEVVIDRESALAGARDIIAEMISDHAGVRAALRNLAWKQGVLNCQVADSSLDTTRTFELYYAYSNRLQKLKPHQVLAINRGEKAKILRVKIEVSGKDWQQVVYSYFQPNRKSPFVDQFLMAAEDSAHRLLLPTIERDLRRMLSEQAESHAIKVFAENLRALISQPPITDRVILGIDPGFRTGCKAAVIDSTGKVLDTKTIYPHKPQGEWEQSKTTIRSLISDYGVSLIVIGNGTASRETEQLAAEIIRASTNLYYMITNEAGASVYSASPIARKELPDLDVSMRGAVSIARRVLDPLAELVKINPKSIGVGLYQHDVDQRELSEALDAVVESAVNRVGVNVNTASAALLAYVSGIGSRLAEKIVEHRDVIGSFSTRHSLLDINGLGPKVFEQAAGFLRIPAGTQPLDETAIHPESYPIVDELFQRVGINSNTPKTEWKHHLLALLKKIPQQQLALELGVGLPTLQDIIEQLLRPGRDPRSDLPAPLLRSDILKIDDLHPGEVLSGTVRNIVDFGAFIDIGVKQDGLLHRSQMPIGTEFRVGDILSVKVLAIDQERKRISLGLA